MSRPIPARPNLERDRKTAKALKRAHAERDLAVLARIREHHPRFRGRRDVEIANADFTLADAQLVIAREYGVESWPRWKALAEFLCADFEARSSRFLEAAIGDDPRPGEELLARAPELAGANLHTACAACDVARVAEWLARDPATATRRGGPIDAEPLWTLCFSNLRLHDDAASAARVAIARRLLELGADPNATAIKPDANFGPYAAAPLLGTLRRNQPRLTEVLLEAGARADADTFYHASECRDAQSLRALLAHGAPPIGSHAHAHALDFPGSEKLRLLLAAGADPNEVHDRAGTSLHHAARRGRGAEEIDLLLEHGAAIDARDADGRSAYAIARRHGERESAEHLERRGAATELDLDDAFAAACASGDEAAARALLAREPGLLAHAAPELFVEAARRDHREAVRLMLDLGFPIESRGGFDFEATALNHAALHGHVEMVALLLERGADVEALNQFGGTALGAVTWASRYAIPTFETRPRPEPERQRDLVAVAERLLAAGARIVPGHLENASPALAELLRRHGATEASDGEPEPGA
jgi:ankyrin repeat protein